MGASAALLQPCESGQIGFVWVLIYYPYRYSGRIPDSQGSRRVPTTVHGTVARGPFHSRSTIACALGLCQIRRSSFMSTVNQTFDEKAQGKLDGYVVVSDAHVQQLLRCAHALGTPSLAPALARSLPPSLARSHRRSLAPAVARSLPPSRSDG